jgi:chromosome segregation ATPase
LALSNQLAETRTDLTATTARLNRQTTDLNDLNLQITQAKSEHQALNERNADLTNQMAGLTNQIASLRTNLEKANKDYGLLDNRFRRDVAERVLVERKFNNLAALKAQVEELKWYPAREISADRIREGLDVVVKSNQCYVIAPE